MPRSAQRPSLESLHRYLRPRRHSALLTAIIVLFAVRPLIGDNAVAPVVFSLALMFLLLIAVYTSQLDELMGERQVLLTQRRHRRIIGVTLAAVAIVERIVAFVSPGPRQYLFGTITWFLFLGFIAFSQLRTLLRHREVTSQTISMAVSVYLLLGLVWGLLYSGIHQLHPDAFNFGTPARIDDPQTLLLTFVYFSFTTISTIGFGDITPLSFQARYAAVAEGITGQFYLAILVARLVSLQMSRPHPG